MIVQILAAAVAVGGGVAIGPGDAWQVVVPTNLPKGVSVGLSGAADRLKAVLAEGADARVSVVCDGSCRPERGGRIFVGGVFAEREGLPMPTGGGLSNAIAEKDGDIYLYGRDRTGANANTWQGCVLPSAMAAVRFMEQFAGAAFLMPGVVGTEVPRKTCIVVPRGYADAKTPALAYGAGRYPGGDVSYCYANGIVGYGAFHTYGGHTYPAACPRKQYFKTHPEYFGMKGGKRTCGGSEGCQPYCISNRGFQELLCAEMLRRYDAGAEVCQLGQQDGMDVCECPECEAMYGTGKDWCEKFWRFHREIAERMQKIRPGKMVHVMCYGHTARPPKSFREFPDNVMVEICHYTPESFAEWKKYHVPGGFTAYMYTWGNYPLPGFVAKHSFVYMTKLARQLRADGIRGIYRCGYGELFGMEGPAYWVFNHALENPDSDINGLIDGYCRFTYGKASDAMKRFHLTLDQRIRMMDLVIEDNHLGEGVQNVGQLALAKPQCSLDLTAYVYSAETVRKLDDLLDRAVKAEGLSDKQRKRLELVRTEYAYAKNLGAIASSYEAYRRSPSAPLFDVLGAAVLERQAMIGGLYDERGRMRRIPGWREISLFGNAPRHMLQTNGRLSATLGAPLTWDIAYMRENGILPGTSHKEAEALRTLTRPLAGDFESGAWASASWQDLGGVQLEKIPFRTRFKALYDDAALYLGIEADLPDDVAVPSFGRDGSVYRTECCDLVIDPAAAKERYYHFIWTPQDGDRYDATFGMIEDPLDPNYRSDYVLWDGDWTVGNRRSGGVWRTLLAVPFKTLGSPTPKPGDRYCMNLGRVAMFCKKTVGRQMNALWSPNLESGTFGDPSAMGTLIFR